MDALVLGLATSGLLATAGSSTYATFDVMRRLRRYRHETGRVDFHRAGVDDSEPTYALVRRLSFLVATELDEERAQRTDADQRIAAFAGATSNLRGLVISGAVLLAGVMLGGAADIVAAVRAH
jgi:hypothetical protein